MKPITPVLLVSVLVMNLGACANDSPAERAIAGGLAGAGAGAVIGGSATGRPSGALVGAAIGGASGALVGATTAPDPVYAQYCRSRDEQGRPIEVPC